MLAVQRLADKSVGTMTEPCAVCQSTTAPRVVDGSYTVCESRPTCHRRRFGEHDRREPLDLGTVAAMCGRDWS